MNLNATAEDEANRRSGAPDDAASWDSTEGGYLKVTSFVHPNQIKGKQTNNNGNYKMLL